MTWRRGTPASEALNLAPAPLVPPLKAHAVDCLDMDEPVARPRRMDRMMCRLAALLLLTACSSGAPGSGGGGPSAKTVPDSVASPTSGHFALVGGTVVGVGLADVTIRDGKIEAVGEAAAEVEHVDATGRFLVPAFIDSHVHLTYYPVSEQLLNHGIVAAVDLAAPLDAFSVDVQPLTLLASGPMITAVQGYPTLDWGRDGYGLEVATPEAAKAAVDQLFADGAALIKTPFTSEPSLSAEAVQAVVARAHEHQLKVVGHALEASAAARAASAGIDVLGHTPVEPLDEATLAAFSDKAVISTLAAFGGAPATIANLKGLRERGATILYGTDLGNTRDNAIQVAELQLLAQAGLDGAAILASGTTTPAAYFGFSDLGSVTPGKRAALLVLAQDPLLTPETLAVPVQVYIDGKRRN